MAVFTYANWETLEKLWAYRSKTIKTATAAVAAATDALETALEGITDDTGVAAAINAGLQAADNRLDGLENAGIEWLVRILAPLWQSTDTTPDSSYLTLDSWFTAYKSSLTNPLMCNETVEALRAAYGAAAVSAANASGPSATSYGTSTVSGATTVTNSLVTTPVDTNLYGGGLLEAYVDTQIEGAANADTVFTLVGIDINGSVWGGTCTIADATAAASVQEVVPTVAKTYPVRLTDVTVADAESGAVTWRIKEPRIVAAS